MEKIFERNVPGIMQKIFLEMMGYDDFLVCLQVCKKWKTKLLETLCRSSDRLEELNLERWRRSWIKGNICTLETAKLFGFETHEVAELIVQSSEKGHYACLIKNCVAGSGAIKCFTPTGEVIHTSEKLEDENFLATATLDHILVSFPYKHVTWVFNVNSFEITKLTVSGFGKVMANYSDIYTFSSLFTAHNNTLQILVKKLHTESEVRLRDHVTLDLASLAEQYPKRNLEFDLKNCELAVLSPCDVLNLFDIESGELKWTANTTLRRDNGNVDCSVSVTRDYVVVVSCACFVRPQFSVESFFGGGGPVQENRQQNNDYTTSIHFFDKATGKLVKIRKFNPHCISVTFAVISSSDHNNLVIVTRSEFKDVRDYFKVYDDEEEGGVLKELVVDKREQLGLRIVQAQLLKGRILLLSTLSAFIGKAFALYAIDIKDGSSGSGGRKLQSLPMSNNYPVFDREIETFGLQQDYPSERFAFLSNSIVTVKMEKVRTFQEILLQN